MIKQVYEAIDTGDNSLPSLAVDTASVVGLGFLIAGLLIAFGKVPSLANK